MVLFMADMISSLPSAINLLFMFLLCALSAALYPIHLSYYQSVNAPFIFGVATTDLGWEGFLNFW